MAKSNCMITSLHVAIGLLGLVLLMQRTEATTFAVSGSKGWSVPSDNSPVYNQWAEKMRFQIGDSILFVYPSSSDSVLRVTKEDYNSCNANSPIAKYTDGHTEFKFNQSGPYYFISGNKDKCQKNEKIVVVVLADRSGKNSPPSPPSPVASAPAPAAEQTPAATPPATGTSEDTPAPAAESHPPPNGSGAASFVMGFMGSVGAFVGSSLLLGF